MPGGRRFLEEGLEYMAKNEPVDWQRVEAVMACCVRGAPSGGPYIPSADERRLLDQARQADLIRYRTLHKQVKAEAEERLMGGWSRGR